MATPANPRHGVANIGDASTLVAASEQRALQRAQEGPKTGIPVPGGVLVDPSAFAGIESLPTQDHTKYLSEPDKYLLKDPKPGSRYVWAAYDDTYGGNTTSAKIRSQQYRPVKPAELKDGHDFDVHFRTHRGTTDYVHWRDLILCEVREEVAQRQYDAPVARYIHELGVVQDTFQTDVERASGGRAVGQVEQSLAPA